tara:strand:- start:339 stop:746 length:408 start_codon:yes stop_codon:yes gene_type:complete
MANALYPKAKESFLSGDLDLPSDTIKAQLIDTGNYTYSTAHDFLDDVGSSAKIGTAGTLGSKTVTSGVFDAADITYSSVTGATVEAIIIYKDTGNAATSNLIAYIDTASSGLPVTPNGGDITVTWDSGGNKIFAL